MNRQLSMEFVRITEQAALKSGRLMGTGDKEGADQAAVDGMHEQFAKTPVSGTVVIGEGEIDEAPMLYIGEHVGAGGEEVDIAVDPVEGTNLVAKGQDGAIAVLAIAPKGCLLHAPDMYMQKICVGPRAKGRIDINASVTENLKNVADAMNREISDLTVVILDRERHESIIGEAREAGAGDRKGVKCAVTTAFVSSLGLAAVLHTLLLFCHLRQIIWIQLLTNPGSFPLQMP